jgi:23S rRNA (adenine2503-C2)-methyltransferase
MPVNKRWNLDELMKAAAYFEQSLARGERFTFEYVLLDDCNDSSENALELAALIAKYELKRVKINLIPHNSADTLEYRAPTREKVEAFKAILEDEGISAYVRRARGDDIFAACGQLAAYETSKTAAL